MSYPKVSIIILNWNGKEDTIECLDSLKHITYPNYEILLVDNGSTDGSVNYFKKHYPEIELIENGENLGFAKGNNVAILKAMEQGSDYILLLNNDTIVDSDFLMELVKVAESDEKIGIVGPKIYYYNYDGHKDVIWSAGGKISPLHEMVYSHIGLNEKDAGQFDVSNKVDWISGAAILIKTPVLSITMLNPNYFFGNEDVEICIKARKKHLDVVYVPTSKIWHKVGASRKKKGLETRNFKEYLLFIKQNFTYSNYIYHCFLYYILIIPLVRYNALKKKMDKL